ncbi:MAG: hypothetical protein NVS4B8_01330 [Herpetosiphon sp.]
MFLLDAKQDHLALLANGSLALNGAQIYGVPAAGMYHLHIVATDAWQAAVSPINSVQASARAERRTGLAAHGPYQSPPLIVASGQQRFTWHHTGDLQFTATLWSADGRRIAEIANQIGPGDGDGTITLPSSAVYFMNVQADGDWTLSW